MARQRRGRSLVEDVYEALRSDILFGRRLPSSRLQLNELAEEHGVSLSVVREAVTRLAT
ncbi:MAG: GntR family transcriptional regulator, partial [Acidimicrobiales bacterium]